MLFKGPAEKRLKLEKKLARQADKSIKRICWTLKADQRLSGVEFLAPGEKTTIKRTAPLEAHWISAGGYVETTSPFEEAMEPKQDYLGFHVCDLESKVARRDYWTRLEVQAVETIVNEVTSRISCLSTEYGPEVLAGLWLDPWVSSYLEQDNTYHHFLARFSFYGVAFANGTNPRAERVLCG